MGFDQFEEIFIGADGLLDPLKNFGNGKFFSGGPTCEYNGNTIPIFAQWSDSGGINPTILTNILRYMDSIEMFTHEDGKIPFLLLDAHGSRLTLEFLRYVNDPSHKWCVCIGVPYGTSLWQVADSEELNASFQIACSICKELILCNKFRSCKIQTVTRYEILPCLTEAFQKSYARVTSQLESNL